ncbi:MAG: ribonuclease III, partial [Chloroflexi bacterium]|nr:ribonuclease III [Chloroflexota bacterium]
DAAEVQKDYKSRLQELAQGTLQRTPTYHVVATTGPDHARSYTVAVRVGDEEVATGHGPSKRSAEQDAARRALDCWTPR